MRQGIAVAGRVGVLAAAVFALAGGAALAQDPAHDHQTPARQPSTRMGKMLAESSQPQPVPSPDEPAQDRAAPKNEPPGTIKKYRFWYGPYSIPPGEDGQRVDLGLPLDNGFMLTVEPRLRNMDMSTPSMLTGHIHHAHWFVLSPSGLEWIFGNGDEGTRASFDVMNKVDPVADYGQFIGKNDKQLMVFMLHNRTSQGQKWWVDLEVTFMFGTEAQLNQPDVQAKRDGKTFRDISSIMSGSTFDVPRQPKGDGEWNTTELSSLKGGGLTVDQKPGQGLDLLASMLIGTPVDTTGPYEWIAPKDGTLVELGTHMHPGSTHAIIENMGSPTNPCPNDHKGTGGTLLLRADTINMHVPFSDDYQIEISQPGWRVPIHKGDHIRLTGYYENLNHAWPSSMTISGMGIDYRRPPQPGQRCEVYRVGPPIRVKDLRDLQGQGVVAADASGKPIPSLMSFWGGWPAHTPEGDKFRAERRAALKAAAKKRGKRAKGAHARKATFGDPIGDMIIPITDGIPNRQWHHTSSPYCGEQYQVGSSGKERVTNLQARPCDRPEQKRPPGQFTNLVTIANFLYEPGDMSLAGTQGAPPRIHRGQSLEFVNADQAIGVRHSVTTCKWPCNGPYMSNYPTPDGVYESGTFGPDPLGDGMVIGQSSTPKDLPVGKYAYFCRIHPWMRGAFEVVN